MLRVLGRFFCATSYVRTVLESLGLVYHDFIQETKKYEHIIYQIKKFLRNWKTLGFFFLIFCLWVLKNHFGLQGLVLFGSGARPSPSKILVTNHYHLYLAKRWKSRELQGGNYLWMQSGFIGKDFGKRRRQRDICNIKNIYNCNEKTSLRDLPSEWNTHELF